MITLPAMLWFSLAGCELLGLGAAEEPPPPPVETLTKADADVLNVYARKELDATWTFHVTVSHFDQGWQDHADGWDIVLEDGTVLKAEAGDRFTKPLRHPHDDEQPFTRTQKGIRLPEGVSTVRVRAHDKRHDTSVLQKTAEAREEWRRTHEPCDGWGGEEVVVDLTQRFGDGYSVRMAK